MKRIEDHCCDCATENYPCKGSFCSRRNVPVFYCDKCEAETDPSELYIFDDKELCRDCLIEEFPTVEEAGE